MDLLRFLSNQDDHLKEAESSPRVVSPPAPFSVQRLQQAFPVIAPLFSSEMCVSIVVGIPSVSNSNNACRANEARGLKSLAQQLRDEEAQMQRQNQQVGHDKLSLELHNEGQGKDSAAGDEIRPTIASTVGGRSACGRASGYAPRGRRGGRGEPMPAPAVLPRPQKRDDEHVNNNNNSNSYDSSVSEIFPPTILSDFKKTVLVDEKMPASSERAFHAVMNCVYLSVLIRDRPFNNDFSAADLPNSANDKTTSSSFLFQECAEKAVAFYCDKLAWMCHKNKIEALEDGEEVFSESDVSSFVPVSFVDEENNQKIAIVNRTMELLRALHPFLLPLSHSPFLAPPSSCSCPPFTERLTKWRHLTRIFTSVDDETSVQLCKCKQIAGRLENFRWQVIRKMIDTSITNHEDSAGKLLQKVLLDSVLLHWDPLAVLKRNFPLIFSEWFDNAFATDLGNNSDGAVGNKSRRDVLLSDMILSPGSYLGDGTTAQRRVSTMSLAFAKLIADAALGGNLNYQVLTMESKSKTNSNRRDGEEENKCSLKLFAQDVVLLRNAGFPRYGQTTASASSTTKSHQSHEQHERTKEQGKAEDKNPTCAASSIGQENVNVIDIVEVVSVVLRWWSVLLKEQCPVCSLKVY